jgi:hypothetical protein
VPIPVLMRLWGVCEFETAMEIVEAFRKKEVRGGQGGGV